MNRRRLREIIAWCFYDFGQSAFSTIIVTFIFSAYFARMIAKSEVDGVSLFSTALGVSGFLVAIFAPFLGAIADRASKKKPWIFAFTVASIIATASLFFAMPKAEYIWYALGMFVVANTIIEMGQVFYNSYLPVIAPRRILGEISGYGWGSGYIGGLFALIAALIFFIDSHWISHNLALNIRSTTLLAAGWMIIFCAPFFIYVRDHYLFEKKPKQVVEKGIKSVVKTFKAIRSHKTVFRYLIARLIYTDAINTLLSLGGVFAAVIFDMQFSELLLFGISMNIAAGLGAFLLAKVDDKIGSVRMILISLLFLVVLGFCAVVSQKLWIFWTIALCLGVFIGPVQSASRSLMAHLAPRNMLTQMFGFYALSGKVTSFLTPFFVAVVTRLTHSERFGMGIVFVLMLVGGLLMIPLAKENK